MTPAEQSELFRKAVLNLEVAGELNPIEEAERRFEQVLKQAAPAKRNLAAAKVTPEKGPAKARQ